MKDGNIVTVDVSGKSEVEIPEGATNVIVIDKLGQQTNIIVPQNIPELKDSQKDRDGNKTIESNEDLYYKRIHLIRMHHLLGV